MPMQSLSSFFQSRYVVSSTSLRARERLHMRLPSQYVEQLASKKGREPCVNICSAPFLRSVTTVEVMAGVSAGCMPALYFTAARRKAESGAAEKEKEEAVAAEAEVAEVAAEAEAELEAREVEAVAAALLHTRVWMLLMCAK